MDYRIETKNEFIESKSKSLGNIDIRYNGTWDETIFNDLMCSIVAAINQIDKSYNTAFVAGASGAAFNSYWSFGTNNCSDLLLMGDKLVIKTFQNLGLFYSHYRKSITANWAHFAQTKIVECLDQDFPAIVRYFDGYSVISGYEDNGKVLYGSKMFFDDQYSHFPRNDYKIIDNVIIIDGVNRALTRRQLLKNCLEWDIHMSTLPDFFNYENNSPCVNGIACYNKIIELLQNEDFFNIDNYNEQKIIRMIYEYSHVKLKDYNSENGNYMAHLKRVFDEIYNNFIQFNLNKRKFAPQFLRIMAEEFDDCAMELVNAAISYDRVYELYTRAYQNAPSPSEKYDEQVLRLKDAGYRNMLVAVLNSIKEAEMEGISNMKAAIKKISSVVEPEKPQPPGDVG